MRDPESLEQEASAAGFAPGQKVAADGVTYQFVRADWREDTFLVAGFVAGSVRQIGDRWEAMDSIGQGVGMLSRTREEAQRKVEAEARRRVIVDWRRE